MRDGLIKFFIILISSFSNLNLSKTYNLNIIISSLIISAIGILCLKLINREQYLSELYVGVFIGMSTYPIRFILISLGISSALAVILLAQLKNMFIGFGGKLGTIAFLSCLIPYWCQL